MTIKSAGHKSLILIVITAVILCLCGAVFAGNSKDTPTGNNNNSEVKLPEFKEPTIKFDEDDQKFFVWLNKFFPEDAAMVKVLENNPKEYEVKFRVNKSRFRRLWKGYKESTKLGESLVVQVRLRHERTAVLEKYKATEDKKTKESLSGDLKKVVSKEFDIAMEIKRISYEELRARIAKMKDFLVQRDKEIKQLIENKDAEVKKRVADLLKEGKVDPNWKYPKNKGIAPKKDPNFKMPVFKEVEFTADDQKFFVWLNEFFPDYAQDITDLEKNPKEYINEFNDNKTMFRRLWGGYKYNQKFGKILIEEVKLRVERFGVITKLQTEKEETRKANLHNDLNKIVSEEFEVAVKIKKNRYEGLKRKIKKMEDDLAKRIEEVKKLVDNKDEEVKKRIEDLISGEEKINWN